jgi:hypothetical protein
MTTRKLLRRQIKKKSFKNKNAKISSENVG